MFNRATVELKEDCSNNLGFVSLRNELPALLTFSNLLTQLFQIECKQITQLASNALFLETLTNNWKRSMRLISAADGQFRGRSVITQAIWNIPLYFNVYFILYMSYLILKSIAGHRIKLPHIKH